MKNNYHKLLQRQIRKNLNPETQEKIEKFLKIVSESYHNFDYDKNIIERSMQISSEQLLESNVKLKKQKDRTNELLLKLKEVLRDLAGDSINSDPFIGEDDILQITDFIQSKVLTRKEAEDEILRKERRFRFLISNISDLLVIIEQDATIRFISPTVLPILGYHYREVVGRKTEDFASPKDRRALYLYYKKVLSNPGLAEPFEVRLIHKNGYEIHMEAIGNNLLDDENVGGIVVAVRDVSLRIKYQAELINAKDAAEAGSRAKSEFLATMSHEIRTPLNGVIGMTSLLAETELNDLQKEYVDIIRNSGEALLTVINDILDYSKIEAGKMDLEEAPLNVISCIEETIELLTSSAESKKLNLAYYPENELPELVLGDTSRLRQILLNLVGNALKFTSEGDVLISVRLTEVENGIATFLFTIRDTGIGIAEDKIDSLFNAFSQADSSTTRRFGGTGLGLAICKRLVELMNGTIWAKSTLKSGSEFFFTIRAKVLSYKSETPLDMDILKGKKILVLDDHLTNLRILSSRIYSWGMIPVTAESALQALTIVKQNPVFDLILLDMQMPEMSGLDFAINLKEKMPEKNAPVILITSFLLSSADREFISREFVASINKPLKHNQLLETIYYFFLNAKKKMIEKEKSIADDKHLLANELPLKILVAEDNTMNQKIILHILRKFGYDADLANSGIEVMEFCERRRYNLIFMDIQMPEMDGVEATRRIINEFGQKRPLIIALTANAMEEDRKFYLASGIDDYISKPIKFEDVFEMISKHREILLTKGD